MDDIEFAVADWKTICEQAAIDKHPSLWVGHYTPTRELIGSVHATTPKSEPELITMLASPFATAKSAVAHTWVVLDRPGHIMASHLSENRLTHWRVPYRRGDHFKLSFAAATKTRPMSPMVERALVAVWEHRLTASDNDFDTAYWYAIKKGGELG